MTLRFAARGLVLAGALAAGIGISGAQEGSGPGEGSGHGGERAAMMARADLLDGKGEKIGSAALTQTDEGVRIEVEVSRLAPGPHAFHIHAVGQCHGPDFKSAGGHFNPFGKKHGLENPEGPHAGDLENFEAGEDGKASFTRIAKLVTLKEGEPSSLFQPGGTCLMIHATADDNKSDPAGDAGDRIACGVIEKAE